MFSRRTNWDLKSNAFTQALEAHQRSGRELLDLTVSNPTRIGLTFDDAEILRSLSNPEALTYDPQPPGLLSARKAVAAYYSGLGASVDPEHVILTTSTSEAYSFVFRLLCDPEDEILIPSPSYPLFEFL